MQAFRQRDKAAAAWIALVVACAQILLPLQTSITLAATPASLSSFGIICSSAAAQPPELPGVPVRHDDGNCCVLCPSPGAGALPAHAVALVRPLVMSSSLIQRAEPSKPRILEWSPNQPRGPPHIA